MHATTGRGRLRLAAIGRGALSRREVLGGVLAGAMALTLAACAEDHEVSGLPAPEGGTESDGPAATTPGTGPAGSAGPVGSAPDPASWTGPRADVQAIDNTFRPRELEVAPGTMVVWRNAGRNDHDVMGVETDWGVTVDGFGPGAEFAHVFTDPGEFHYYCTVHGTPTVGMIGMVRVTQNGG